MHVHLRAALEEIERATGHLDVAVIGRPVPGGWSIAEILEHLTLAFRANTSALEKALASGELRARAPELRQRLGRILVVDLGYFPRVSAPKATTPSGTIPGDRSREEIRAALGALDTTLERVAARFGDDVAVANHPYFAGLTVHQWRKFHWRHTRHHAKQIVARAR